MMVKAHLKNLIGLFKFLITFAVLSVLEVNFPRLPKALNAKGRSIEHGPAHFVKRNQICHKSLTRKTLENGFFAQNGQHFFYVKHLKYIGEFTNEKKPRHSFTLMRLDLKAMTTEALKTFQMTESKFFRPSGPRLDAVYQIRFKSREQECPEGEILLSKISLKDENKTAVEKLDFKNYRPIFITSWQNILVFNGAKHKFHPLNILESAPSNSLDMTLDKDEIPLYVHLKKRHIYTLLEKTSHKLLKAYSGSEKVAASLKIGKNQRILQNESLFGILDYDSIDNFLTIIEVPRWSPVEKTVKNFVYLPKVFSPLKTHVKIDFDKKILTVAGGSYSERKKVGLVQIYNYQNSWKIGEIKVPSHFFISEEYISPDGKFVLVEISDTTYNYVKHIAVFSVLDRKWKKILTIKGR